MLHEHFRTLAHFNQWANRQIYEVVAKLPAAEVTKQRPAAYFGSILNTLNHLLVVDRLWFGRVADVPSGLTRLDEILYDDFAALRAACQAEDQRIIDLVDGLDDATLAGDRAYSDTKGRPWTMPVRRMLTAVFNHQTHHRGQVHALLKEAGVEPPALDLPVFMYAEKWK
jgi:uncharacterized damage-inducible protein DinB